MDKQKLIKILKILNLVALVFLLKFILFLPHTNCGLCSFEFEGESIGIEKLFDINFDRCPIQTGSFPQGFGSGLNLSNP